MLQQAPQPDDYVVATGESHSVREFLELAAAACGAGLDAPAWRRDPRYFRPTEVDYSAGRRVKARNEARVASRA